MLSRDPDKLRAWQRSGPLRQRGRGKRARAREREKDGPQCALARRTACAARWVREMGYVGRGEDVPWHLLPMLDLGQRSSDPHHESTSHVNLRRDADALPLSRAEHRARTDCAGPAEFWGWRPVVSPDAPPNTWERVGGGLDVSPGPLLEEMRRRVAEGWRP